MNKENKSTKGLRLIKERLLTRNKTTEGEPKSKVGFTIIELIVVMAVIAILVLLAAPKFLGYTQRAQETQIRNDVKVVENMTDEYLMRMDILPDNGAEKSKDELRALNIYDTKGRVSSTDIIEDGPYKLIGEVILNQANTKLTGRFYGNDKGKVYYESLKDIGSKDIVNSEAEIKDGVIAVKGVVAEYISSVGALPENGVAKTKDELKALNIYGINGLVKTTDVIDDGPYKIISEEMVAEANTTLKGSFYGNDRGEVYYEGDKTGVVNPPVEETVAVPEAAKASAKPIGVGTADNPYEIWFLENIDYIRTNVASRAASYKMMRNLDFNNDSHYIDVNKNKILWTASETSTGWVPIGSSSGAPFNGNFDGNEKTLTGLFIKRTTEYVGLFGYVDDYIDGWTSGGVIEDFGVIDVNVSGSKYVGGLVAYFNDGFILDSHATGNVTGVNCVGGLVGISKDGVINRSYATGNVTGVYYVGGLIGWSEDQVSNSHATGNVNGTDNVGGLAGEQWYGKISYSYATGNVNGTKNVGGLVGAVHGTIANTYATGKVSGTSYIGGLVGEINDAKITDSYATGDISGTGEYIGGLVGRLSTNTPIINSYATGNVSGADNVGGLAGLVVTGAITNSYATGTVKGTSNIGGLVGYLYEGEITNSYATGDTSGAEYIGGLVGDLGAGNVFTNSITSSYYQSLPVNDSGTHMDAANFISGKIENFTNWDATIWKFVLGQYPKLAWQE